ncbi:G patch domain-containing protein 8 [Penicillium subrubescens]|uniref:G patch domain-containing protein 8 n=1 Tax=Penicillium subrubescens TaxID=1316194 RepID=A0A1Q5UAU9_9EURO|nr:G patch domain-containing protein 8 [Penicillium subrubescens]
MPPTESARSALSAFTCTLCNKSYSRHPEYEAHISSYDHQHRKRLQDLKQLSRDPNAAEKARRAERRADAEAGLKVLDAPGGNTALGKGTSGSSRTGGGAGGGGFKKGGFKSSFSTVKGPVAPVRKNVLGDDDDEEDGEGGTGGEDRGGKEPVASASAGGGSSGGRGEEVREDAESDTDEEYTRDRDGGGYYDPRRPTGCYAACAGLTEVKTAS